MLRPRRPHERVHDHQEDFLRLLGEAAGSLLDDRGHVRARSEEHTSELQSRENLVCRFLLEKKKSQYTFASARRPLLFVETSRSTSRTSLFASHNATTWIPTFSASRCAC